METKVELVHRPKKSRILPLPPLDIEPQTTINSARSDSTKPDQPLLLSATCSNTNSGSLLNRMNNVTSFKPKKNKIFKNLEKLQNRCDSTGFPILKGGKNHKICFKENIAEIMKVESFKRYNCENTNWEKTCWDRFCVMF